MQNGQFSKDHHGIRAKHFDFRVSFPLLCLNEGKANKFDFNSLLLDCYSKIGVPPNYGGVLNRQMTMNIIVATVPTRCSISSSSQGNNLVSPF